jgi:hypothetical protein
MNVVVRTTIDPGALAQTARAQALKVDPDQPVHSVTTMERLLDDTLQQDRFAMLLVALFAAAGLVTAVTGVYALLAYMVAQRRREIAVTTGLPRRSLQRDWWPRSRAGCLFQPDLGLSRTCIGEPAIGSQGRDRVSTSEIGRSVDLGEAVNPDYRLCPAASSATF